MRLLTRPLLPHPASAAPPGVKALHVRAHFAPRGLTLSFVLQAEPGALRLPPPELPQATDGLWQHTCFEAFIGTDTDLSYREFNFAPSHRWEAYRFAGYRVRDPDPLPAVPDPAPRIATRGHPCTSRSGPNFILRAQITRSALPPTPSLDGLRLGLSAVLEASDGSLSWWALRHPCERPDFHHRGGFVHLPVLSLQST